MRLQSLKQRAVLLARPWVWLLRSQLLARPAHNLDHLDIASKGPLVVAGLFRTASGIGESARRCADALEARGLNVRRCDLSDAFKQVDLPPDSRLEPFPNDAAGTLIIHLNAPETVRGLFSLRYCGKKNWRIIGYWVWEFEVLPKSWSVAAKHLNEIWTPSAFSAEAIRKRVNIPVNVTPHFVEPPKLSSENRFRKDFPEGAIVTLVMGDSRSSHDRKNLLGSIKTFLHGVGENPNCWLLVKTRNFETQATFNRALADLIKEHPRIRILDQSLPEEEKWLLLDACDIFLSLHRSEGFGLVIAEAMALGKAVVATAWSGNMEFMTPESSCLVPYALISTIDQAGIYENTGEQHRWADPDLEYATNALRKLTDDNGFRKKLGEKAITQIKSNLDGSQYLKFLRTEFT